ncbi:hypothetical protein K502DRAFT_333719 [Neoconidiobolus thromboides FSU 785]|nr:hypothetical protein K502DRAFT_333719 [Neoconidiobolus thromboides FSU 785]
MKNKKGFVITNKGLSESKWSSGIQKQNNIKIEVKDSINNQRDYNMEIPMDTISIKSQLYKSRWSTMDQDINDERARISEEYREFPKSQKSKLNYFVGNMSQKITNNPNKKRTELQNNCLELLSMMLNYSERELTVLLVEHFKYSWKVGINNGSYFSIIKIIDLIMNDYRLKLIFTEEQLKDFGKLEPIVLEYQRIHTYGICDLYLGQVEFVYQQLLVLFKLFENKEEKEKLHQRFKEVRGWKTALRFLKNK